MNIISTETKNNIKNKINLLSYLEQYFDFEVNSGRHFTCCPFHNEDTPSFMVDTEYNTFHCFGCGAHGDIINFVMRYDNISFSEALEKLSKYANVEIKELRRSYSLEVFKNYNRPRLYNNGHVILSEKTYNQYPRSKISLWEDEGISSEMIKNYDIRMDMRGNRIIYPVRDINGNLINIKGRTTISNYKSLRIPKYINYYKVGVMDYLQGLDKKLDLIKGSNEVIIFEGIKSCMKLDGWSESPCVSSETSSLTPEQIELLLKLHCDITIAYDKDKSLEDISKSIHWLSRFTNLYIVLDKENLLGSVSDKQSPVDMGYDVWKRLYNRKERVRL